MAPTIGRLALNNGFHGSIPGDLVALPPQNIHAATIKSNVTFITVLRTMFLFLSLTNENYKFLYQQTEKKTTGNPA